MKRAQLPYKPIISLKISCKLAPVKRELSANYIGWYRNKNMTCKLFAIGDLRQMQWEISTFAPMARHGMLASYVHKIAQMPR